MSDVKFEEVEISGVKYMAITFRITKLHYVYNLPKIDKDLKAPIFVYWYSPEEKENATGDGQVWAWYPGASYYIPLQRVSYHNGVPDE